MWFFIFMCIHVLLLIYCVLTCIFSSPLSPLLSSSPRTPLKISGSMPVWGTFCKYCSSGWRLMPLYWPRTCSRAFPKYRCTSASYTQISQISWIHVLYQKVIWTAIHLSCFPQLNLLNEFEITKCIWQLQPQQQQI